MSVTSPAQQRDDVAKRARPVCVPNARLWRSRSPRLRAEHEQDELFRRAAVELFRETLETGRARIIDKFLHNRRGFACARALADLQDDLIRGIHDYVVTHVVPPKSQGAGEQLAVIAVGGYGRGTLAPASDIDLLFLLSVQADAVERRRGRGHALCHVGPEAEGWPRHPLHR